MTRRSNVKDFGSYSTNSVLSDRQIEHAMSQMSKPRSSFGAKVARALAWVVALGMIVGTAVNGYLVQKSIDQTRTLDQMIDQQYNPSIKVRYSQLGQQIISSWYNGGSQPVPLEPSITWPDLSQVQQPVQTTESERGQTIVIDSPTNTGTYLPAVSDIAFISGSGTKTPTKQYPNAFTERLTYSVTMDGLLQNVTILLRINDLDNIYEIPTLMAAPSIENPADVSIKVDADKGPTNLREWKVSEEQMAQLEDWAQAFATDDRAGLKRLVADKSTDSVYVGIVNGIYSYPKGSLEVLWSRLSDTGDSGFARVRFPIEATIDTGYVTAGEKTPITRKIVQYQTMDLLVKGQNTALLQIVSWGSAGTYDTLSLYSVAFTTKTAPVPFSDSGEYIEMVEEEDPVVGNTEVEEGGSDADAGTEDEKPEDGS